MKSQADSITTIERADGATKSGLRWKWLLYLSVAVVLVVAARYFHAQDLLRRVLDWIGQLGPRGAIIFIATYIAATVLFIPGSVLTLGAGAIFGVVWGSIYVSVSATLGATCAFMVSRYIARGAVARKIEGDERFAAIDRAVASEGWKIVGLTRLSPVIPFTLFNYAFGLTKVSLGDYVFAPWLGMMPGTVIYVYLGSLARAGSGGQQCTPAQWAHYGVGLLATVVVTLFITRIARRALAKRIKPSS